MALARQLFLWASENKWLEHQLTRRAVTQRAVQRFLPGVALEDGLYATDALSESGITTILPQLGENVTEDRGAEAVGQHYMGVLDSISERGFDSDISIKPTQFGLDLGFEGAYQRIKRVVQRAGSERRLVGIDMEGSDYVDPTLDLYRKLRTEHANVAICLQAYLHRTASDLASLLPSAPTIRLVKGAYKEPHHIAIRRKSDVDTKFLELAETLLRESGNGNARVFF